MASRWRFSLPLFTKELLEQAARRRTYVIRVAFVGLLSYFTLSTLAKHLQTFSPLNVLGQGLPILQSLVEFEFNGIFLLLPAMACGVFTSEKERNTLSLLFLTRLGPWTIIIEKLLGRLFPMLMFLCCAMPVMAFLYSLGGLTLFQLFISAYYLLLALFLTGCAAVMCSALTHSTASAFVYTYLVLMLISIAPYFVAAFIPLNVLYDFLEGLVSGTLFSDPATTAFRTPTLYSYGIHHQIILQILSPYQLWKWFVSPWSAMTTLTPWLVSILLGIPSLLASLACLLVTRWALYRRAFVAPSNPLLKFFRRLDKIFFWANRNVAFDIKLVSESDTLPGDEPIAWREVSKRALGQFRYLVRIMIPLLFPVIFVGSLMVTTETNFWRGNGSLGLTPLVLFLLIVDLVLIAVTAANSIPMERMRQTWDVLRSIPLTGRDILLQKLRGVRRLQWVCAIPVLAAIGLQAWLRWQLDSVSQLGADVGTALPGPHWWEYLLGAVAGVWVYSELVKWLALWCGLMIKNPMRAILAAFPVVAVFSVLPSLILFLIVQYGYMIPDDYLQPDMTTTAIMLVWQTCPIVFVSLNELGNLRVITQIPLLPALLNIAWNGALLLLIRRHMLNRAEWYLGRIGLPAERSPNHRFADAGSVYVAHAASVGGSTGGHRTTGGKP